MKINNKNCEKGFALALALIMLVVMSIMGATIMQVVSKDHQSNNLRNDKQQTFYAAETGITEAKRWLLSESSLSAGNTPSPKFCYTSFFPDLVTVKAINNKVGRENLDDIITTSDEKEKAKLAKYSFEYFVTYSPDNNGSTENSEPSSSSTSASGSSSGTAISLGKSYKTQKTGSATYYTIYSCGCNDTYQECKAGKMITKLETRISLGK